MRIGTLAILVILVLAACDARANDRYVRLGGSDAGNDCTTSGTPCGSITWAVGQAASGDVVKVASAGYYFEAIEIATYTSLTLSGGWSMDFATRDPVGAPSVVRPRSDLPTAPQLFVGTPLPAAGGFAIDLVVDGFVFQRGRPYQLWVQGAAGDQISVRLVDTTITKGKKVKGGFTTAFGGYALLASAQAGAAVQVEMERCRIVKNKLVGPSSDGTMNFVAYTGGTISLAMTNSLVARNKATNLGGGLLLSAVGASTATADIVNSTITANRSSGGAGIAVTTNPGASAALSLKNTILWGNSAVARHGSIPIGGADLYAGISGTVTIDLDHVDRHDVRVEPAVTVNDLGGNLDVAPGFAPGDRAYHLTSASPLVDVGTDVGAPPDDIDGDSRPLGDATDIGADEVIP